MLEEIPALPPVHFFSFSCDLSYGKTLFPLKTYLLPDTTKILREESLATIAMAWNEEGLLFQVRIKGEYSDEDQIELFLDTRDLKEAGYLTKFCHHFIIAGEEGKEVTKLRIDESRPLSENISVELTKEKNRYEWQIAIPSQNLYGFEPSLCDRLGFTYRVHRLNGEMQHFVADSPFYAIEEHPSLWASLKLLR